MDYIKITVTIVLAVLGWITAYYFTRKREISAKQRDIVTRHLVRTYRVLTNDISHRATSSERQKKFEIMISDIQLFGSVEQVELVKTLADECVSGDEFQLDPLINSLRKDLRKRLNLSALSGNVTWVRL